jgi:PIN domain nuclease of toxin-antitoxin system
LRSTWGEREIAANDLRILAIEPRHTAILTTLPFHHRDPFDRLLIAQALAEGIAIVGADAVFDRYGVERIW